MGGVKVWQFWFACALLFFALPRSVRLLALAVWLLVAS